MEVENAFNDLSTNSKILGLINAALFTAILIFLFKIGILISLFVFFVVTVLVWIVSPIDYDKENIR